MRRKWLPLVFIFTFFAITTSFLIYQNLQEGPDVKLEVHFIDVGQGDAILIDLGDTEVLIDGGGAASGVAAYIRPFVEGNIEAVIATHPHADHIGGLPAVFDAFTIEEFWHNGDTSSSKTYAALMQKVEAENTDVRIAKAGDMIVPSLLEIILLNPISHYDYDGANNRSIVVSLKYASVDFLFTGDAERQAEMAMAASSITPLTNTTVLKVGHHGSSSSSMPDFLNIIKPEVAIYMAGENNQYGHPHTETISALEQVGALIYGTDTSGTIIITTDGDTYQITTGK